MNVIPCTEHSSLLSPSMPWHRVLEVADDCPNCTITDEEP